LDEVAKKKISGEVIKMSDKLTVKQEKYVQGLFAGLSQREAYKQAYNAKNMTDKSIDEKACELAKNVKVASRLKELVDELKNKNIITIERVMQEYAKLGFFDPRNLFRPDGSPKEISELDDETAAALAGLDVQEVYEGSGEDRKFVGYTKKYKLTDKKSALDSIAKCLGMFVDKIESKNTNIDIDLSGYPPEALEEIAKAQGQEEVMRIVSRYKK
jgi:phage terminase small subunit